jgi:hypothetical protein
VFAKLRSSLTYANVMATSAVFLALGGGAYAALQLPANSVGARQLQNNAVRSPEVKDRSLLARDFKQGQLPRGPRGFKGAPGRNGRPGTPATRYWANISDDGTLRTGTATGVDHVADGIYSVRFSADVSRCAAVVTPGFNDVTQNMAASGAAAGAFPGFKWNDPSSPGPSYEPDDSVVGVKFFGAVAEGTSVQTPDTAFNIAVFC